MKKLFACAAVALGAALTVTLLVSQNGRREQVGPLPGGGFLLNTGWKIQPAGKQIDVDTMPMSSALAPDGRYLLVLNGGYKPPSISVIDTHDMKETSRVPVPDAWLGLTFSQKGDFVYVGGGSRAAVYEFAYSKGTLVAGRTFPVVEEAKRTNKDFIGDVAFDQAGHLLYAADLYHDRLVIINPQSGMLIGEVKTGRRPYRILFPKGFKSFYVSSWADGSVSQFQTSDNAPISTIRLGAHTVDMLWKPGTPESEDEDSKTVNKDIVGRLFVAAANTNSVFSVGVTEGGEMRRLETINVAMTPNQPLGMTPSALGIDREGKRLYVACSDANAVAAIDISLGRSIVQGFIPTGWYPMAVNTLTDNRIVILNGRGLGSHPNPDGPNPTRRPEPVHAGGKSQDYVMRIQTGTISVVDPPDDKTLDAYSQAVIANSPYKDSLLEAVAIPQGNPIPSHPGDPSPIKHVIYIVQENRTYDQVLGDMKKGNNDPSLVLFGENTTPNHHKIADQFVLFDNFYVSSDVSADGHNWATAAIAPDYTIKLSPNSYAGRRKGAYDYEGQEIANRPPAGYIWTNAHEKGISLRNYGYYVNNLATPAPAGSPQIDGTRDSTLTPVTNPNYRGFDLEYSDIERAKVFLKDLAQFEADNQMPQLILMRMGNDHTYGAAAGKTAPKSLAADNDQGVGMVVEAVSKSKFWSQTAIFIIEDDAQNGADHVDSHRSPAYLISPYVRRGSVDSSMYNTTSVLRTIELILGLNPMTTFDAAARPMFAALQNTPDLKPFESEKARIPLDTKNPANTAAAIRSRGMHFSQEDRIDDDELNAVVWAAIKGPNVPPPAPVRSRFSR